MNFFTKQRLKHKVQKYCNPVLAELAGNNKGFDEHGIDKLISMEYIWSNLTSRVSDIIKLIRENEPDHTIAIYEHAAMELAIFFQFLFQRSCMHDPNMSKDERDIMKVLCNCWLVGKAHELMPTLLMSRTMEEKFVMIVGEAEKRKSLYKNLLDDYEKHKIALATLIFVSPLPAFFGLKKLSVPLNVHLLKFLPVIFGGFYDAYRMMFYPKEKPKFSPGTIPSA